MAVKKITSKQFWRDVGKEARDRYKDFIFEKGQTVFGTKWWGGRYSPEYKLAKSNQTAKSEGRTGNAAYKDKVTAVLVGDLQNDLGNFLKPRNNGVKLGYPTRGERVAALRKRKGKDGTVTSKAKPLPDPIVAFIKNEYHKFIKRNQKATKRVHKKR